MGTVYMSEDFWDRPAAEGRRIYNVDRGGYEHNPRYRGEAWCESHDCSAEVIEAQANRVVVRAQLKRADWLVLNQNAHPQWSVSQGDIGVRDGLAAAHLDTPGEATVEFRYRPTSFLVGLPVSLATLIAGSLATYAAARRRRKW